MTISLRKIAPRESDLLPEGGIASFTEAQRSTARVQSMKKSGSGWFSGSAEERFGVLIKVERAEDRFGNAL